MKIIEFFKEHWLPILITFLIFMVILYFSGMIECWTGGYCPTSSNLTSIN